MRLISFDSALCTVLSLQGLEMANRFFCGLASNFKHMRNPLVADGACDQFNHISWEEGGHWIRFNSDFKLDGK